MRFEQLQYVEAVARLGSFRRAAEELHISQPALSETVRNLERELGVTLLDRTRTGARVSTRAQELYPRLLAVLDAVDELRRAVDDQLRTTRMVRVGTVNAATVTLVTPTIREFRETHPSTQVEVVGAQQDEIHRAMLEGTFDLGLVTYLDGDDLAPAFETHELLRGRAIACMRSDNPLVHKSEIGVQDLLEQQLVGMRSGYLMHRFLHRFLEGHTPSFSFSTDGAEMGKLMVAEGLGVSVLPDFSVVDDPLEQRGVLTIRPLAGQHADVMLGIQRRRSGSVQQPVQELHDLFVARARAYGAAA